MNGFEYMAVVAGITREYVPPVYGIRSALSQLRLKLPTGIRIRVVMEYVPLKSFHELAKVN